MKYKIIADKLPKESQRNLVPIGELATLFSSLTKFNIGTGNIIQPIEFMRKLISSNEYKQVREILGDIHLYDKDIGMDSEEIINHSESTAKNLSFLLLNIKKYQLGKKTAEPLIYMLSALLHKVANIGDLRTFLNIDDSRLNKIIRIIENYKHNKEVLEVLLHKNSSKIAIKVYMENSIKSPEELLLYFSDVMDTIESVSKRHINQKEIVFLQVIAELAEYYELEAFSYSIYSFLFRVTEGDQHQQLQEYMFENIAKKYGKEVGEQHLALEELVSDQIETLYTFLEEIGVEEKAVVITGRIKQSFSIAKKINMVQQKELARNLGIAKNKLNDVWSFFREKNFINTKNQLIISRDGLFDIFESEYNGAHKKRIIEELQNYSLQNGISEIQEKNLNEKVHDALAWRLIFKKDEDMYHFFNEFSKRTNITTNTNMYNYENKEIKKKVIRAFAPKSADLYGFCKRLGIDPKVNKNRYESLHISMQERHIHEIKDANFRKKLIMGEIQIRTFDMHYRALTEASHVSMKADEEFGGEEISIEAKFIQRKSEIQNKMVVTINGSSLIVPYRGHFAIALYDLYFEYLCKDETFSPRLISVNGMAAGKNKRIRNGDQLVINLKTGSIQSFLNSLSNRFKLKQQIEFVRKSPLFKEKGEDYLHNGQLCIRRVVTGAQKKLKMTNKKFVDMMNENYGDKRNNLTMEDCQIAVGMSLVTEQSLRAHINSMHKRR